MPKYLIKGSYTAGGTKGLLSEGGTSRKAAIDKLVKSLGGTLEVFYYAFGDDDVIVIADLPDDATAVALSLTAGATGTVTLSTTALLAPETIDEAAKKTIDYRPAGS